MDKNYCCCKLKEAQAMLTKGTPLSVIARTLNIKISDILNRDNPRALGK